MRALPIILALVLSLVLSLPAAAQQPPLPRERPEPAEPVEAATAAPAAAGAARVYQTACPAVLAGRVDAELLPPITAGQCRVQSPFAVTAVRANGRLVPLSAAATLGCAMASALPGWVAAIDGYLMAREDTRLARVLTGTSYMCRGRNRDPDADISEHGFANALDVVGFELEDGRRLALPGGWELPQSPAGRALRFAHGAACARFTTTLGPEANALHEDHLHLDLGCHGESCTARLCE